MSANDGARMAWNPYSASAQGACSREEPPPKFEPATRIEAPCAAGRFSSKAGSGEPSGRKRQSKNRNSPNPVRSTRLRNCFGMIWSVSTLTRGSGHGRAHQMGPPAFALPPLEVPVRGRGAALTAPENVLVHAEAHRAAGVAPLEARVAKHAVQTLRLRRGLHPHRAGHDHCPHAARHPAAPDHGGRRAEVLDPGVGAGAEEHTVHRYALERR